MTNNDFYWYWFTNIAGIGVKTQKKLLEHFGHPSTIYNAPESEIKGILTTGQCKEVIASKNQKKIEASIRKLEKREIYFFHRELILLTDMLIFLISCIMHAKSVPRKRYPLNTIPIPPL